MASSAAAAPSPTRAEMHAADAWMKLKLLGPDPPFSFVCGGRPSRDLLPAWSHRHSSRKLDARRVEHVLLWDSAADNLQVRCVAVVYTDYPVVEWTVTLRNTGALDTPILDDVQGLDTRIDRGSGGEFTLSHWRGDSCTPDSYEPLQTTLGPGVEQRFAPAGGRPTNGAFPYFRLQRPGDGLLVGVGWPGQWAAAFARDQGTGLRVTAGQQRTHLRLRPGEEIRTSLSVLLFWLGDDTVRAQNVWRRWMLAHNTPRPHGTAPAPMLSFCSGGFFPGLRVSEESEKQFIDALTARGVKLDYWWMDAGWYPCTDWPQVGTWEPDPQRFPRGIRAVSDTVHGLGMKLIVWFEPERVEGGSWLAVNHPEWLLGGKLLNLGNPDARRWLTDHVDRLITEQGIDLYRQDFNMDPLEFWRAADAPDRQGMTENLHVQGYLAYWDELRHRHPDMLIDSCASGGRRNDLETLRRAVPLLRSDYQAFDGSPAFALGNQTQTYGLSSWLPYYGTGVYYTPEQFVYCVRSYMCPAFGLAVDVRKPGTDWELYRRMVAEWRRAAGAMLGDYYPLMPYSLGEASWMAWQFDRPDKGDGIVQAFRRSQCEAAGVALRLHGLEAAATYEVANLDGGAARRATGRELAEKGLEVRLDAKPAAALLRYHRLR